MNINPETKKIVICDTSIWFGFREREVTAETVRPYKLFSNYLNLFEIGKTPKLLNDWRAVKHALLALRGYSHKINEFNAFKFLIRKQFPDYRIKDLSYRERLMEFEALMTKDDHIEWSETEQKHIKEFVESSQDENRKAMQRFNDLLQNVKKLVRKEGKDIHRSKSSYELLYPVLFKLIDSYTAGEVRLDIAKYPWKEIEFFIKTWDNFFIELEIHPSQKMH